MKITPAASNDPLNRPKKDAALKPLAGEDFAEQLSNIAGPSGPTDSRAALRPLTPTEMIPGIKGPVQPLKPLADAPQSKLMPLGDGPFNPGRPRQPKTQHDQIQETARKLVAQTFYGPMLKQMRDSPFKSEMFSGGRGGQAFASMLDQHLAEHMSKGADSKLVRAITRKLEAKTAYRKQSPPKSSPASDNPYQNVRIHVAPGLRA